MLLRMLSSTCWSWAVLKDEWRACHRLFISRHSWLLYLIASITSNLHLLTQFMSSQEPCFLFKISWILRSKNWHFIFLTVLWNCFQSSKLFDNLYLSKSQLQLSSHQLLEYLVMLITFKFFFQAFFTVIANSLTAKLIDSSIKTSSVQHIGCIDTPNRWCEVFDECQFFFAVFNDWIFSRVNVFFSNGNNNS